MHDFNKLGALLYHKIFPGSNFYKLSLEAQKKYVIGIKSLLEEIKNDQPIS